MCERSAPSDKIGPMICAAIDIGSNTTRLLVAEPQKSQLRKVMEQRAYTAIGKDARQEQGKSSATRRSPRSTEVVATQVRLAQEMGAEQIRTVATAAIREAKNGEKVAKKISKEAGVDVEVLSDEEEGRLAFLGATKSLGHTVEGSHRRRRRRRWLLRGHLRDRSTKGSRRSARGRSAPGPLTGAIT